MGTLYICYTRGITPDNSFATWLGRAREEYRKGVITKSKTYNRFLNGFSSSVVLVIDCEAPPLDMAREVSEGQTNLQRLLSLLYTRRDLVEHFFFPPTLGDKEMAQMVRLFDTEKPLRAIGVGEVTLTDNQIEALAAIASKHRIFVREVTEKDLHGVFFGNGDPLTLCNPYQKFGAFLATIAQAGCIYRNYQKIISTNEVVLKSDGHPISDKNLKTMVERIGQSSKYDAISDDVRRVLGVKK